MPVAERELTELVRKTCQEKGLLAYHTYDSRMSAPGFPDWVIIRHPVVHFLELKTDRGRVSDPQREWAKGLRTCTSHKYRLIFGMAETERWLRSL